MEPAGLCGCPQPQGLPAHIYPLRRALSSKAEAWEAAPSPDEGMLEWALSQQTAGIYLGDKTCGCSVAGSHNSAVFVVYKQGEICPA